MTATRLRAKATDKRKLTLSGQQRQIDELRRQIEQSKAQLQTAHERVEYFRGELHDLGHAYQRRCNDIRDLYATLRNVREALAKPEPLIAAALALIASELDD